MNKTRYQFGKPQNQQSGMKIKHKRFFWIFLSIVLLAAIGILLSWYYNLGSFAEKEVSGLSDQHIRISETKQSTPSSLLFSDYESYEMNYEGRAVELRLDYYEFENKTASIEFAGLSSSGKSDYNGLITWGILPDDSVDSDFGTLKAEFLLSGKGTSNTENLTDLFSSFTHSMTMYSEIEGPTEISSGESIPLRIWSSNGVSFTNFEDYLKPENMTNQEELAVLYLDLK